MKTCNECVYAIFKDYGYSNWTVEGTQFLCVLKKHPDGDFDRFYGENPKLEFADKCDSFLEGDPINMDVEQEGVSALNQDKTRIWYMR